jgi:hypothetical protein
MPSWRSNRLTLWQIAEDLRGEIESGGLTHRN